MTMTIGRSAPFLVDADTDGLVIAVQDASRPAWQSFADAAADLTEQIGTRWRIPRWAAATVTWWWATAEARLDPPQVTPRARTLLKQTGRRATRLIDVLSADPAAVGMWPVTLQGPVGPVTFSHPTEFGFIRQLRDFQAMHVARLLGCSDGCDFSVPGAGKTSVAYAVWGGLAAAGAITRCVVIAPLSAHQAWATEPDDCFAPMARPSVAILPTRPGGDVVVYHYEALQDRTVRDRLLAWLRGSRSVVFFDEAHRAKRGRGGLRGAAALALADAADHRFVLTGTPAPNNATDLGAMFDLAWPGSGQSLMGDPRSSRCFVRATKSDLHLAPQAIEVQRVPLSAAHRALYDAMVDSARAALADPAVRDDLERIGKIVMLLLQAATDPAAVLDPAVPLSMSGDAPLLSLTDLARQAALAVVPGKFVRVRQLVDENAEAGLKTLVWSNFRHHIAALEPLLAVHQPAVVTGHLAQGAARDARVDAFRNDSRCHVLLATPQTLGEGVSLHHACQRQVHVDRTYNAGVFLQSLDRTHRLGMPEGAEGHVTLLVAEGTIDEHVEARLARKAAAMAAMLDDPDLIGISIPELDTDLELVDLLLGPDHGEALADLFGV